MQQTKKDQDRARIPWNFRKEGVKVEYKSSVEYHPLPTTGYDQWFAKWNSQDKEKVGVVVPFFNEEAHELHRTLHSLFNQMTNPANKVLKNFEMHILLVMDGWFKASRTMKAYIKELFPSEALWKADYFTKRSTNNTITANFIVHNAVNGYIAAGNEQSNFYVSLLVKIDNRRKHNSHQWFFHAFDRAYRPKYMFATDCGTAFASGCVEALTSYLDNHALASAVTGRQRIMDRKLQGCEDGTLSIENYYRLVQTFDFESAITCYSGAFSLFGFLPVIPGPCGLFRMSDIRGAPLDWYFKNVNQDPDTAGILLGNLLLAEDRLLSWAAALKTEETRFTMLVPEAVFYFEAETELEKFVPQRRRWQNGTFAGYLFILQDVFTKRDLFLSSNHSFGRKLYQVPILIFMLCQVLQYFVMSFSPAIFLGTCFMGLQDTFVQGSYAYEKANSTCEGQWYLSGSLSSDVVQTLVFAIFGFFAFFYAYFAILHHNSPIAVRNWAFHFLGLVNVFIVVFAVVSIAHITYEVVVCRPTIYLSDTACILYIIVGAWLLPFFLGIFQGRHCIWLMLKSAIPYLTYLPTIVGGFQLYSISRLYDLTWGNRPSEKLDSLINNDLGEDENTITPEEMNRNREKTKADLHNKAATVLGGLLLINAIILLVQVFLANSKSFILYFLLAIFSASIIQMVFSALFFMSDPLRRIWKLFGCFRCYCMCFLCPVSEKYDPNSINESIGQLPKDFERGERTPLLESSRLSTAVDHKKLMEQKLKEQKRVRRNLDELEKLTLTDAEEQEIMDYLLYDVADDI
eukprot:TRINITY_DN12465_c0_g1_i1.p1 TRINITY_DN12465_c0_g1~~TRINITY_DN12465_c0_g1_i1.p1  ORF type:complete len:799 (+),score=122.11 TRINITY_DN12465_c0_g1_i1:135-2531(+)